MLDPVELGKSLAAIVREATAPLLKRLDALEARQPEKGEKGADADPIDIKDVVAELVDDAGIRALVDLVATEAVQKHFEAHPVKNGTDGAPGKDGAPGERGEAGEKGADGIGSAGAMIDRDGCLILTMTNGVAHKLGNVVGKDGEKGKDGQDLSDISLDFDGHRTITVKAKSGEIAKAYKLGIPLDAGYYREGMSCEKGDIVTREGNAWLALRDTKAKPCHENKEDWRLFARRGRDGLDGKNGRDLGPAPPVQLNA